MENKELSDLAQSETELKGSSKGSAVRGKRDGGVLDLPMLGCYITFPAYSGYEGFMYGLNGQIPNLNREAAFVGGNMTFHLIANRFRNPVLTGFGAAMLNAGAFVFGLGSGTLLRYLDKLNLE